MKMTEKVHVHALRVSEVIIRWCIVIVPFSIAVAPAFMNGFVGLLLAAFLVKKALAPNKVCAVGSVWVPLFLFFAITCLSLVNSVDYRDTIKGGIMRLFLYAGVMCAIADELKSEAVRMRVVLSAAAGCALASIDGIWQVAMGHDFIRGYAAVVNIGLVRATASFKDPNTLGVYLSALAPLAAGACIYERRPALKALYAGVSLLTLAGVALTYSRPTILALYVVAVFFAAARKNRVLLASLIVLLVIAPFLMPPTVKEWARQVEYNPLRFMCNDDRIAAYRTSLRMIAAHPVIGVGANTYMKNYKAFKENPEYRNVVTPDYMYAHNSYLQMASELGMAGAIVFLWFLIRLFAEARALLRAFPAGRQRWVVLSLAGCLIAFLVNGLTESSLYYSRVAVLFWLCAGMLLSLRHQLRAHGT